ncbi:hypothetical protein [Nonomuraea indica]|uniref:hypothetical protein n=1 Tax=Nonomuraea indica TaxID=1581193 RepID=UPI000C7A0637|nr:hypothetical protein [Nonomuraea indica]
MDRDQRPANVFQDIRDLQRDVKDAQGAAPRRPALIEASAGWVMRHRSTPPTPPAGDIHIYAQNGRLWVNSSLGQQMLQPQLPFPKADLVEVGVVSIPNAPATYDQAHSATLRSMIFVLNNALTALIATMRANGLMNNF